MNGNFGVCLFDMDGVLTDTASVHAAAWKAAFDAFLQRRSEATGEPFVEFDIARDYHVYVDGKPRDNGVADFLASRGVTLPRGTPTDPPGDTTVWAIGNAKNVYVLEMIASGKVVQFDDTFELIRKLREKGMKTAVVSSSANTEAVLEAIGKADLFDERVDGVTIIKEGLTGKPAPDTFVLAAKRLGFTPDQAVVFEDALAGVAAGRAGDFGLVVGVNRINDKHAAALVENGADFALSDLTQLISSSNL
jgi:beta-phosphoglucomutase family hydrolase